jgi:hypothetical protein
MGIAMNSGAWYRRYQLNMKKETMIHRSGTCARPRKSQMSKNFGRLHEPTIM